MPCAWASARGQAEVTLDDAQRRLVRELGDLVGSSLGIDSIPCRGMWLEAVRAWQKQHQRPAKGISALPPAQRLAAAIEIKDHFLALAASLLHDARQRSAVQSTVDAAYALYVSKYQRR